MATVDELSLRLSVEFDPKGGQQALKLLSDIEKAAKKAVDAQVKGQQQVQRAQEQTSKAIAKGLAGSGQVRKAAEEQAKAVVAGEKRKQQASSNTADLRKDLNRQIADQLKVSARDEIDAVLKAEQAIVKARRDGVEETGSLQRKAAGARAKLIQKEASLTEQVFDERIKDAKAGSQELIDLEDERIKKTTQLAKKEGSALRAEQVAGTGRAADELGENFSTISASIQSGDFAGAAAFVGQKMNPAIGQMAGVAGTAVDAVLNLAGGLMELGERALVVDAQWSKFRGTLALTDVDISIGQFNNLRVELQAIQRPLGVAEADVAKLAGVVSSFADSDKIGEVTSGILDLKRIAGEGIDLDRIAGGVGRLTAATGDSQLAIDLMAKAAVTLRGVADDASFADGMIEATTELGNVISKANIQQRDQRVAAEQSLAIFGLLAQEGFQVSEATSAAEITFESLNATLSDTAALDNIAKKLPEGIDLVSAGLEEGNLDAIKFADTLLGMGEAGRKLATEVDPELARIVAAMDRANLTGDELREQFGNIDGSASKAAAALTPLSAQLDAIKEQRMDDFATNFGRNFTDTVESGKQSFVDMLDFLATADFGFFNTLLDPLRDLFVDSRVEAEKLFSVFDQANQIAAAVEGVVTPLQNLSKGIAEGAKGAADFKEFTTALNQELPILAEHSASGAEQIRRIQESADRTDAEKIREINDVLSQISQQKSAEAIIAMNKALVQSREAVDDLINSTEAGFLDTLGGAFDSFTQLIEGDFEGALRTAINTGADSTATLTQQIALAESTVNGLSDQWAAANGNVEEQQRLSLALGDERERLFSLQESEASITTQITDQIQKSLEMQEANAERTGETFDRQVALTQELQAASAELRGQPELLNQIRENVEATADAESDFVDASDEAVTAQTDLVGLTADQGAALDAIGITRKAGVQDQITEAQALQAQNTAIVSQLQSQLAVVDSILAGNESQEAGLLRIAQIEQNITAQKQAQATVAAGGEAEGVEAITTAELTVDTNLEGFREQLVETIAQLESDNEAIDDHISGLQSSARSSATTTRDREKLFADEKKALEDRMEAGEISADEFNRQLGALEDEFGDAASESRKLTDATDDREIAEKAATAATVEREKVEKAAAEAEARREEKREDQARRETAAFELREAGRLADQAQQNQFLADFTERIQTTGQSLAASAAAALASLEAGLPSGANQVSATQQLAIARSGTGRAQGLIAGGEFGTEAIEEQRDRTESLLANLEAAKRAASQLGAENLTGFQASIDAANEEIGTLNELITDLKSGEAAAAQAIEGRSLVAAIESIAEEGRVLGVLRENFEELGDTADTELAIVSQNIQNIADETQRLLDLRENDELIGLIDEVNDQFLTLNVATGQFADENEVRRGRLARAGVDTLRQLTEAAEALAGTDESFTDLADSLRTAFDELPTVGEEGAGIADLESALESVQETARTIIEPLGEELNEALQLDPATVTQYEKALTLIRANISAGIEPAEELTDAVTETGDAIEKAIGPFDEFLERFKTDESEFTLLSVLEGVNQTLEEMNQIIDSSVSFIDTLKDKDATDFDKLLAGAELAKVVGGVLLQSGIPQLQVAGAVLIGGALMIQAVSALAGLFKKGFEDTAPAAQRQADIEQAINDRYEARKRLIDLTVAAGGKAVDQAREMLKVQTELTNAKLQELGIGEDISELDRQTIQDRINLLDSQQKELDILMAQAVELGNEDFIAQLESSQIILTAESEKWTSVLESQAELLELQNQLREEQIGLSELLIRLGADEGAELQKQADITRGALEQAIAAAADPLTGSAPLFRLLKSLGVATGDFGMSTAEVGDLASLTGEQLEDLVRTATGLVDEQISGPIVDLINGWLDSTDKQAQYNEGLVDAAGLTENLFSLQKRILEQQLELNEITEDQFTDDMLELLNDELERREDIEDELREGEATQSEILAAAIARMDIELEIQRLLAEQNGELSKSDAILTGIVARRQDLLETFRGLQGRGDLTPQQQAQLAALTTEAVTRLRESGASEEEIESFLAGLPQFQTGGFIPQDTVAQLHAGEVVLPSRIVDSIGADALTDLIRRGPVNPFTSTEASIVTQTELTKSAAQLMQSINISSPITININGSATPAEAARAGQTAGEALIERVQRGIDSGEINPQR